VTYTTHMLGYEQTQRWNFQFD